MEDEEELDEEVEEAVRELVIARLSTMPDNMRLSIG